MESGPVNPNHKTTSKMKGISTLIPSVIIIGSLIIIWELISRLNNIPTFILPAPSIIALRFRDVIQDNTLLRHSLITLQEVLIGLTIGLTTAISIGYLLAKSPTLEKMISPLIVASQATPIVAVAPLLLIWLGPGLKAKYLTAAIIVFFPVMVNTIVGLRSIPQELVELMRSLKATQLQTLTKLEAPASLPILLGGLRIGATLSVIGAVVGEFVGADRGLGFLINQAKGQYDYPLVFVAVISLIILALILYSCVLLLESVLINRHSKNKLGIKICKQEVLKINDQ